MKIKGRTILVLALLLFGGYAVYDYRQDVKQQETAIEESRLMTLNFEQVDRFEIQKADSKISLIRTVDGWELDSPIKDSADNTVADDFVKNVYAERIIEVAKQRTNIDWSVYGLDKPLAKIIFKSTNGQENVFEVSEKTNFESNGFIRRNNENKVLVVNSVWIDRAKKTVLDFRDRRFLRHKIASVDELKLKNAKGLMQIQRTDGKWISAAQKDFKLDQNKVREILNKIAEAKAADILAKDAKIPAGKPLFTLDLTMAEKKWKAEVTQAKDLAIYAQVTEPQFKMKMEPGALDNFISLTLADLKEEPAKDQTAAKTTEKKE